MVALVKCKLPVKIDYIMNTVYAIIKEDGRTTTFKNDRPGISI